MVVQHNLRAMNSNRMLGLTTASQSKSTEKFSSGYKINRAADDAAGLAISEKMRKQIRGLTQASLNAQDGISAVQTAEGALTEVHDMLQRMNELAVKSANGTNSNEDRKYIQDEIDQLVKEIDRVAETTKFNETYLLKGDPTTKKTITKTIPGQAAVDLKVSYKSDEAEVALVSGKTVASDAKWYVQGGTTALTEDELKEKLEINDKGEVVLKEGVVLFSTAAVSASEFGAQLQGTLVEDTDVQAVFEAKEQVLYSDAACKNKIEAKDLANQFNVDGSLKNSVYAKDKDGNATEVGHEQLDKFVNLTPGKAEVPADTEQIEVNDALTLNLHVGADGTTNNKISLTIESMGAKNIGVDGLKVDTEDAATASIEALNDAVRKVSTQRAALGAVQNRLEHTVNNLDNVVENTTAAEAQIRDTDMATEMVRYSNNNILAQAGQAMLAQSNQANQGVLSLLQ